MTKTRKEWFKDLPLQKRLQATENVRRRSTGYFSTAMNSESGCLFTSLSRAFTFSKTKQGHEYWWNISRKN